MWSIEAATTMNLMNKRIFVVENNLENRIVMQLALLRSGATLEFDRWGRDTVKRLEAYNSIDLILIDLTLPFGISGYDIFDQIRQAPAFANIPIVAISSEDPATALPQCRARGFAGYIAKPINAETFPEQLMQLMNGEQVWEVAAA